MSIQKKAKLFALNKKVLMQLLISACNINVRCWIITDYLRHDNEITVNFRRFGF